MTERRRSTETIADKRMDVHVYPSPRFWQYYVNAFPNTDL
jgi:hypothetical protein